MNKTDQNTCTHGTYIKGNKKAILNLTEEALQQEAYGETKEKRAEKILNFDLIPAINQVGELFEKKKYFLRLLLTFVGGGAFDAPFYPNNSYHKRRGPSPIRSTILQLL